MQLAGVRVTRLQEKSLRGLGTHKIIFQHRNTQLCAFISLTVTKNAMHYSTQATRSSLEWVCLLTFRLTQQSQRLFIDIFSCHSSARSVVSPTVESSKALDKKTIKDSKPLTEYLRLGTPPSGNEYQYYYYCARKNRVNFRVHILVHVINFARASGHN